jgi:succinate dehydrogenase/fumarate reductase cytochrome b subunit
MSDDAKDFIQVISGVFLIFAAIFSFMSGAFEAGEHGQCAYETVAAYFPPHAISCELFKQRWSKP